MRNRARKQTLTKYQRKARRRRRLLRIITAIIGILVIVRIALPFVALRYLNQKLARELEYVGHVDDLDISLMSRSITLKGIVVKKKNGQVAIPYFTCNAIHVHMLSYKERASEITVDSCVLNLVRGKDKIASQFTLGKGWRKLAKEMPLKPDKFTLHSGELHFIEKYRSPDIDLSMKNVKIEGTNLKNLSKDTGLMPSLVKIEGDLEGGKLKSEIKLNPKKEALRIEAATSFSPVNVERIKNFLIAYAGFDVKSGTLSASSVIKVGNNRLDGFIDPVARDLVFYDQEEDKKKKFGAQVKQLALQVAAKVLDKPKTEKISMRIELHGPLKQVKLDVWQIILDGLKRSIIPEPVPQKETKKETKKEARKEAKKLKKKRKKKKD